MPTFVDLCWLPVKFRFLYMYKVVTLTYGIRQSGQPSYLHELLEDCQPLHSLQSAS